VKKVIISLAPVAADTDKIVPQRLAEEIAASAAAGASMVHLHVRNQNGQLTDELSVFSETLELVRKGSDIVIEASTGGISELTIEQRCAPLTVPLVELGSLNVGSCNLGDMVYKNPFSEVIYCAGQMVEKNILPDNEVFEIGMINNVAIVGEKVAFKKPMLFNIVLGQKGTMPATIEALAAFKPFLPAGSIWSLTHYNRRDFLLIRAALSMGADIIRIGFEDSPYLTGELRAADNVELVRQVVEIIKEMGLSPATPKEAREILSL
jgi:3-keto-5-aminohexanoate cleavage enzyme